MTGIFNRRFTPDSIRRNGAAFKKENHIDAAPNTAANLYKLPAFKNIEYTQRCIPKSSIKRQIPCMINGFLFPFIVHSFLRPQNSTPQAQYFQSRFHSPGKNRSVVLHTKPPAPLLPVDVLYRKRPRCNEPPFLRSSLT